MKQQKIIQFVGFATNIGINEFMPEWESYSGNFKSNPNTTALLFREKIKNKKGFGYISKIEWLQSDFNSTVSNNQKAGRFSEHKARVVQLGGYISIDEKNVYTGRDSHATILALLGHNENDIAYYEDLPLYNQAIIYQAYYENCTYGYVIEFTVPEGDGEMLLQQLSQRPGVEASMYTTCLQPQL